MEAIITVDRGNYKSFIYKEGFKAIIMKFNNAAVQQLNLKDSYIIVSNDNPLTIQVLRGRNSFLGSKALKPQGLMVAVFPHLYPNKSISIGEYEIIPITDCIIPNEFILTLKE